MWLTLLACSGLEPPEGTREELILVNPLTDESYEFVVFTPDALAARAGATVMYVFDGPENEPTVLGQYGVALDDGADPAILVLVPGSNRVHDFTPTPNDKGSNGGGQADFIRFIVDEVAPLVEVEGSGGSADKRVTFGHSLGGLLSGTMWYDEPFASRSGIASPSFWWDGGLFFSKLASPPANSGPIVVACGEEEPMGMFVYTADFAEQMRDDHGIDVTYECFKNKAHPQAFEPAIALSFAELL